MFQLDAANQPYGHNLALLQKAREDGGSRLAQLFHQLNFENYWLDELVDFWAIDSG